MNASPRNMAIGVCQQCNSSSHYNFGEFGATEACRFCDAAPIDVEELRHGWVTPLESSQLLVRSLSVADARRDDLLPEWHGNVPEWVELNLTCAALVADLVGRHPEIQDEIDDWADDIDCEGGRTMARFVVDYVMDNAEVIA